MNGTPTAPELLEAARQGDNRACEQVLEENAGLIWSIVRRYYGCGVETDDLYQLGCIGFIKAVKGFDLTYGTQFSTYAVPKIAGEIRRFLRDNGAIKVGRSIREKGQALAAARERLRLREAILTEWNNLPEERTLEQADYGDMIRSLGRQLRQETAAQEAQRQDMLDYYTTWVHQIKTPMAVMKLYLGAESPEHRAMGAELFRMEQYVDMVLMYLRLDEGTSDYVIRACDLDGIIRQSLRKFAGEFIDRKLTLHYEPLHLSVVTDEKWLGFVVEQVLSNALKYTPEGGSITIDAEAPATLCIRDTGIGITAEDLPRIFDRGYTGRNGRTYRQASGIGLYLCRRLPP